MKKQIDIGVVVAMRQEAEMLASVIKLEPFAVQSGNFYTYTNPDNTIVMITPGINSNYQSGDRPISCVGKVSAGVITTLLLERYHPRCIINTGTAGGITSMGMNIGDIVIANSVANHDIRIPLPGYSDYGIRKMAISNFEKLNFLSLPHKIGLVSSGESFTATPEEWDVIKKNKALAKDMESAGIIHALEILGNTTPAYVIKAITDVGDEHTHEKKSYEDFRNNFSLAIKQLSSVIAEVIEKKSELF